MTCFRPQVVIEVAPSPYLRYKLLEYIGNGNSDSAKHMQDAEIGQRIYSAMKMVTLLGYYGLKT